MLVEERDREKKRVSAGTPVVVGWEKVPGANLGSGLVVLGSETGTDSPAIPSYAPAGQGGRVAGPCIYMDT